MWDFLTLFFNADVISEQNIYKNYVKKMAVVFISTQFCHLQIRFLKCNGTFAKFVV